jgi:hypothetical protein
VEDIQKHTHLKIQIGGQERFCPLLQEVDDHQGQDVGRQAPLVGTVQLTDLRQQTQPTLRPSNLVTDRHVPLPAKQARHRT